MTVTDISQEAAATGGPDVLSIDNLSVRFRTSGGIVHALHEVCLTIRHHEVLGIVGESGCGKSSLAMAVMGLLPPNASVEGSVRLRGEQLKYGSESSMEAIRGARLSIVFQDPMASLNPVYTIGYQVAETLLAHGKFTKAQAWQRAVELLLSWSGFPTRRGERPRPARILRWYAPARRDRDRHRERARRADPGRADDGAGRDHPGTGA